MKEAEREVGRSAGVVTAADCNGGRLRRARGADDSGGRRVRRGCSGAESREAAHLGGVAVRTNDADAQRRTGVEVIDGFFAVVSVRQAALPAHVCQCSGGMGVVADQVELGISVRGCELELEALVLVRVQAVVDEDTHAAAGKRRFERDASVSDVALEAGSELLRHEPPAVGVDVE